MKLALKIVPTPLNLRLDEIEEATNSWSAIEVEWSRSREK
tara:strand:- start:3493 stop:3612 length:120 start_codon:yes stop_codon:yes gene_type:complete